MAKRIICTIFECPNSEFDKSVSGIITKLAKYGLANVG